MRWHNVAGTADYVERIEQGAAASNGPVRLSEAERWSEALFTGLRLSAGIDRTSIQARFGADPWARYGPALEPYVEAGLMWHREGRLGLTRHGMLVANEILATFV